MPCYFYQHDDFLLHIPPVRHVEQPKRYASIMETVRANALLQQQLIFIQAEPAHRQQLLAAHTHGHITFVENRLAAGDTMLDDGDTYGSPGTLHAAQLAAGAVTAAVDAVLHGGTERAFCCVRPPGHHAERDRVMGFCYFNNVAVGALHAINALGKRRVAIVDWDVHHGNGTQDIFYERDDVLFISLQQFPIWPGTGSAREAGTGAGKGFTINYPMPAGSDGAVYRGLFEGEIAAALLAYQPELLLISAGFDAHQLDPLGNINLTEDDYRHFTRVLREICVTLGIPIVSVLEGGYNLSALARSVAAHTEELCL